MNGKRISFMLKSRRETKELFQGFGNPDFPLSDISKYPAVFVLNTAPFFSSGEHWCVACFKTQKTCYFFDPYGQSPKKYGFNHILHSPNISYNKKVVQSLTSKTCGHHCIYFIIKYANGYSPEKIIDTYDDSTRKNDNMVYNFVQNQFGGIIAKIRT